MEIHVVDQSALSRPESAQRSGMERFEAVAAEGVHVAEVRTEPGRISGWHHHADHSTYGYVVSGRLRFEYGAEGGEAVDAGPGDFFSVPPNTVHRERNRGDQDQVLVGFRVGNGPTVIDVEGPGAR